MAFFLKHLSKEELNHQETDESRIEKNTLAKNEYEV
jgi:hypothetical protein